jgi:hypothetical protein
LVWMAGLRLATRENAPQPRAEYGSALIEWQPSNE